MDKGTYLSILLGSIVSLICIIAATTLLMWPASASAKCHEDMKCWNWSTMGNHKRGVTLTNGKRVVVTADQLCSLLGKSRVRSAPPLKGDERVCK